MAAGWGNMAGTKTGIPSPSLWAPQEFTDADTAAAPSRDGLKPPIGDYLVFLYLPFLAAVTVTFPTTADDPFITLRYAANLVHGYGLAFNPGQQVQGFTSPLHLLVAVVAYLLPGGHDLFKLKIASLIFGALAIREGAKLIAGITPRVWLRRVGFVALGSSIIIAYASTNGLETSLVTWLLVALIRRLVLSADERSWGTLAILAFLLVFARFDSLVPMACLAVAGFVVEQRQPWWRRSSWVLGAVVAALITVLSAYLIFGFPLPNTYYAKAMSLGEAIPQGFNYLQDNLAPALGGSGRSGLIATVVMITEFVLFTLGVVAVARHYRRCGYLLAAVVGQLVFILKSGGDWMVGGRFLAPVIVPLIVLELLGLIEGLSMLTNFHRVRAVQVTGACALVACSFLPFTSLMVPIWQMSGVSDQAVMSNGNYSNLSSLWSLLPSALACVKSGRSVATTEVGYLGFSRQDLGLVDMRGLTDSDIAHEASPTMKGRGGVLDKDWSNPGSPVGREILKAKPAVIATVDWDYTLPAPVIGQPILHGKYRFANSLQNGFATLWLFVRTGVTANCVLHPRSTNTSFGPGGLQVLRAAVQRTLTARSFDALVVTQADTHFHVERLDVQPPDRAALRMTQSGPPLEVDIGRTRYVEASPSLPDYEATTTVPSSGLLQDLPAQAASLLFQGTPVPWAGQYLLLPHEYRVPPFLQSTVGKSRARISATAQVSNGYLSRETISVVEPGHDVTATIYFYDMDRAAPIPTPTH